ncbi:isoprenylcysteine carboxylmethyltransferase family protein [Mesorhizobium sp. CAU 1741]|uniref:methyltransferase family protein n=1 Tax=Mesorhizobium sp. CAU 1741 TaxID=3140366 RepID=UPI00325BEEC7
MSSQPVNQRMRIRLLQTGGLLLVASLLFAHPALTGDGHEMIELVGLGLVSACVAGRMWSILYIGSRKNQELVTNGPYSISRNPLYFFSVLGAAGVGLFVGSVTLTLMLGLATWLVLAATARKEAAHLETLFGSRYATYASRTPLFWPNPTHYREAGDVTFSPAALKRTFLDGLLFFAAFPAIELVEHLQDGGYLPILFRLP